MKFIASQRVGRWTGLLAACCAWATAGVVVTAQDLINVDFTARPRTEKVGPAAYGYTTTDFWNTYERRYLGGTYIGSGTVNGLRLSDGSPTAASLSVENAPGAFGNGVADPMYDAYVYSFDGRPIIVTLRDLPPGSYTLYLYGHAGPGVDQANSVFEVVAGGSTHGTKATTTGPGWNSTHWQEGQQYVRFSGVDVAAGQLLVVRVEKGGYNEPYINGMQLVRDLGGQAGPLVIRPDGGSFTNSQRVTLIASVVGAEIRYTEDGADPTLGSTRYDSPFELTRTATVKARLFVNGFPASEIVSARFEADPGIRLTPGGGLFTNRVDVVLSSRIPGTKLVFTLDGTDPGPDATAYLEPIVLRNATTIKARAYLNGFPVTEAIAGAFQRVYAFDDDGIASDWRVLHFGPDYATDPRAGAEADPDGDQTSNRQEYVAGTDPLDVLSGFRVGVRAVPEIRFASRVGSAYRILRRSAVDGASTVVAEILATGEQSTWVDAAAGVTVDPAFYTVQPVP